ncbi:hypothetical protein GOP47_0006711 [Adiantum capillus-veneris]|uniref:1-phosphatidylinositol 4-kinase n=1 Tax=Adiantum capillus-veneris TaxID=13818 RepID=A0A9D4V3Y5_ADICA|nr:hypothetical protein GOP47_0006711 [Adiantum capillus-veneris]
MPPSVDTPVKTRFPFPIPDGALSGGRTGSGSFYTKPPACRRIFVQTDTGSVLGIELDQTDSVQTVKKKMQTLLNVPIEQTNLVFGSTVLKSDLSEVRNDSPLLLTRELQRSLSTPCFFHPSDSQVQMDCGQPFEVVGGLKCCLQMEQIIKDVVKALECGVEPIAVSGGLGGAYYFRNCRGESVAVVKPTDEEPFAPNNPKGFVGKTLGQPGLKRAVRVGETGVREVAAYLLDHNNFARVPPTVLVKVSHHVFHVNTDASVHKESGRTSVAKLASCQQFVPHDYDASDHGTSRFSVSSVHRIGILDVRIFNTDRHAGNILIRKSRPKDSQGSWGRSSLYVNETLELIPIDHGLCLPEGLEDTYFEWLHWPQASVPFTEEELEYIKKLDAAKDVDMLRAHLPMLREACHRTLILSTAVLKKAAAAGLCLTEIGEMMTRDQIEERSELELLCFQAKRELSGADVDALSDLSLGEANDELLEQFEFELDENDEDEEDTSDCGEGITVPILTLRSKGHWSCTSSSRSSNGACPEQDLLQDRSLKSLVVSEDEEAPASNFIVNGRASILKRTEESPRSLRSGGLRSGGNSHMMSSPRGKFSYYLPEKEFSRLASETNQNASGFSGKISHASPRAMSYRSMSFNYHKQRYGNHPDRQDALKGVPLTPAPRCNAYTGGNPNQVSLGDMSDEEWVSFLRVFNELLEQALATMCTQKASHRQRLGTSCQF